MQFSDLEWCAKALRWGIGVGAVVGLFFLIRSVL